MDEDIYLKTLKIYILKDEFKYCMQYGKKYSS